MIWLLLLVLATLAGLSVLAVLDAVARGVTGRGDR